MNESSTIERIKDRVKDILQNAEGGHDWWHIQRVWMTARDIARHEDVNIFVVELAALLHDIADPKFNLGDETIGPTMAKEILSEHKVDPRVTEHVVNIIRFMSFKSSFDESPFSSEEMHVVQDADRLDAMGAIGIARAFNYGGFKNRAIYDPRIPPDLHLTKEKYKHSQAPTINHFYEKLLLLKDRMNTKYGRQLAEERHRFMENFLDQFYREWGGGKEE